MVAWLVALLAGHLLAFEVVRRVFVGTVRGQQLDTLALAGTEIGQGHVAGLVGAVLNTVSVLSVVAATATVAFIALIRGRLLLPAVVTATVVGANLTTQVLKAAIDRPELGLDPERAGVGNSLPSGHTTVTASVAVALVLVVPAAVRGPVAVAGAGVAALTGVATLSAGWHRPSDAVAALLVVGAWAALAGLVLVTAGRRSPASGSGRAGGGGSATRAGRHRMSTLALVAAGFAALAVAAVALGLTDGVRDVPPDLLSRTRLLFAYAGGAAGVTGVACAVTAAVLASAHRVVPPPARP
jgi:membrane-associated phospholipid phosphatase